MRRPAKIFVIGILFLLSSTISFAAIPESIINTDRLLETIYTTENGLPQNSPNAILQTRDGYIWIATYGGLARFDGLKFTIFTTSDSPKLISNRLLSLAEDSSGRLWIGSEDGDIITYKDGVFERVTTDADARSNGSIFSIYVAPDNLVWIGAEGELMTYNAETLQLHRFAKSELPIDSPSRSGVYGRNFASDDEGTLWINDGSGILEYKAGKFTRHSLSDSISNIISLWFAKKGEQGGLYVYDGYYLFLFKNGRLTQVPENQPFSNGELPDFSPEGQRSMFVIRHTLHHITDNGLEIFELPNSTFKSITTPHLRSVLFDNEGNLWIGLQTGLVKLRKKYINTFAPAWDGARHSTTSIIQTPDKDIWVASSSDLFRFPQGSLSPQYISLPHGNIISLTLDKKGFLWVGTQNAILKYENGRFLKTDISDRVKGDDYRLFFDGSDNLWIGTKSYGGAVIKNDDLAAFSTDNGLVDKFVTVIFEDKNENIWIGTKRGLSKYKDGKFTNYTVENGLSNNYVRDLYEDQNGILWIGTYGGGLLAFRDGIFTAISEKEGLSENIVSRIIVDKNNFFWILGNRGVYSLNHTCLLDFVEGRAKRVYSVVYGVEDGMVVNEGNGINTPAGWMATDEKLWFPMIEGNVVINPKIRRQVDPPIYIEKAYLDSVPVVRSGTLEIQPGQQNLQIDYTGVTFDKPEQLQFRYKLEGFDSDWQEVGTRRSAFYPYLPPGTYTFKVTHAFEGVLDETKTATLVIIVNAPFWQTTWFFLLCSMVVIALVLLAHHFRLRYEHQRRLKQQDYARQLISAHESERKRIATDLHDSLGHSLVIIKNWASLATSKLEKGLNIKKDLQDISVAASDALEETRTISSNLLPLQIQHFGLTSALKQMVKSLQNSSNIEISTAIDEIDGYFDADGELSIFRIVQEVLNNVAKHSEAKRAVIKIKHNPGSLSIDISDDGKDFDVDVNNTASSKKVNFGINNIQQRTELLGGVYSVRSEIGAGARTLVTLPVNKNGFKRS